MHCLMARLATNLLAGVSSIHDRGGRETALGTAVSGVKPTIAMHPAQSAACELCLSSNKAPARVHRRPDGRMRLALLGAVCIVLVSCGRADVSPTQADSPSAGSDCGLAIATAANADGDAAAAALEVAIGACADLAAWQSATEQHASALEELDPLEFLTDRCVNGPPDLAETSLCESLNVER